MNKKLNSNSSAGTNADSDKMSKIPTSSHACSNTFVSGSFTADDMKRFGEKCIECKKQHYAHADLIEDWDGDMHKSMDGVFNGWLRKNFR